MEQTLEAHLFGALFEHGTEAAFTLDRDSLRVLSANARLEDLVGCSKLELIGSGGAQLFVADERGDWAPRIAERAGLHEDVGLRRLDGYPAYVALTVSHIDHPEHGRLAACIARDTTERRNLERELIAKHTALHQAHTELEKLVSKLRETQRSLEIRNREIAALGAELAQASRRASLGEFSAGVAHSMNNPMAALSSALRQIVNRIEQKAEPELQAELQRFLARSRQALSRMESIVDAVRKAHRTGSLGNQATPIDIGDELRVALALFEQRLSECSVTIQTDNTPRALVPGNSFHQVVSNLVDNSLRALNGPGSLSLTTRQVDQQIVLRIQDSGPGLPEHVSSQLFEPFVTGRSDGSGLGLSTSQRLARQWGGDLLWAKLEPGTAFDLFMPRALEE